MVLQKYLKKITLCSVKLNKLIELKLVTDTLFYVSLPPKLDNFPTSIKVFCSVELLCITAKFVCRIADAE